MKAAYQPPTETHYDHGACLQTELISLDWTFNEVPFDPGIHSIHPYPAKFIANIPRELIRLLKPAKDLLVLDPFCGSGTTLVEAIKAGHNTLGIDLNPLACLISRVKTTPVTENIEHQAALVSKQAYRAFLKGSVRIPEIPRVDHWFNQGIQKALASLTNEINRQKHVIREALQVALSSIIVRVSNQDSDTRYAAVQKNFSSEDVFSEFKKASSFLQRAVFSPSNDFCGRLGKATVINKDLLKVAPHEIEEKVGLVITSPPYPNAYEYWLYHKYRMYWLGMNPIQVRESEIGARPHYFKKNHQTADDFAQQMTLCFKLLAQVMVPKSKACFLVGRSIIHGKTIDNAEILTSAASNNGFRLEAQVSREIPSHRKSFNPIHGGINKEQLLIFSL